MPSLVLTVIGDDRSGLVAALAEVVTAHGGNWERSQMAELAGKFAGIVVVTVPDDGVGALSGALQGLDGLLDVAVHSGSDAGAAPEGWQLLTLEVIGNDRPGIVHELSSVLSSHGLSIETMTTTTREAPMSGGVLFEAQLSVRVPASQELAVLRDDLERLAAELLVDVNLGAD